MLVRVVARPAARAVAVRCRWPALLLSRWTRCVGGSRVGASGGVTGQVIPDVLAWRAGDRLTLTAGAGVVVARRDPGGMVVVLARRAVAIPAALRHRCGLRAGDLVLLVALPGDDALAVYTFAVVDRALRPQAGLLRG